MNYKTIISLPFDYDNGVNHLDDLDELAAPFEIISAAKNTLHNEINKKIDEFRVNNWMMCMIPLGMIVFIGGGVSSMFIFPFSMIIVVFGMFLFMCFPIYLCCKKAKQKSMITKLANMIDSRTRGIIRMETHFGFVYNSGYDTNYNDGFSRNRIATQHYLTRLDFRIIQQRLNLYNALNAGNPNNFMNQGMPGMPGMQGAPGTPGMPGHYNQPMNPNMNQMNMGPGNMQQMQTPFIPNQQFPQQNTNYNVQNINQHYPN